MLQNAGSIPVEFEARARLFQIASAMAVQITDVPWKKIHVLPGQTIIESAALNFPTVKAETRFAVQWLEGTNRIIGTSEVLVYPTNLLDELKPLIGDDGVAGVLDPQNHLKPLLRSVKLDFVDLEDTSLEDFRGRLAILDPIKPSSASRDGLPEKIQAIAKKGVAVVWIQPPPIKREKLQPSFYWVTENQTATVVVQPDLVANLAENPRSQLNLIHFCRLALHPEPLHLPHSNSQP